MLLNLKRENERSSTMLVLFLPQIQLSAFSDINLVHHAACTKGHQLFSPLASLTVHVLVEVGSYWTWEFRVHLTIVWQHGICTGAISPYIPALNTTCSSYCLKQLRYLTRKKAQRLICLRKVNKKHFNTSKLFWPHRRDAGHCPFVDFT